MMSSRPPARGADASSWRTRRAARALASVLGAALMHAALLHAAERAPAPAIGAAPPPAAAAASPHAMHKRPPLAVGAAFAPDGALWVVGLDPQRRLVVWRSLDRGRTWSAPRPLDTGGDLVAADGENRPKIAFGPHAVVVVAYTQPLAKPYTGEIRMLRSIDGGVNFGAPFTVHQDRQPITHRFESIAFDGDGVLHVVWIDTRDAEAARGDQRPYRGAGLYRSWSPDGGGSFAPDIRLADHSCECCRIALAPAAGGGLAALWRHVFEPNIRDHAFMRFDDLPAAAAAAAPVRASFDGWALDACPHHGPGLAPSAAGGYHAVWFGERAGVQAVRTGRLDAQGAPVGPVRTLPDDSAEHADVMTRGRRVAIVWRSHDPVANDMRLRAWLSDDDGATYTLRELGRTSEPSDHPRLAQDAGGAMFVVWRNTREIRVVPLQP